MKTIKPGRKNIEEDTRRKPHSHAHGLAQLML
jgi:hypothetical protein